MGAIRVSIHLHQHNLHERSSLPARIMPVPGCLEAKADQPRAFRRESCRRRGVRESRFTAVNTEIPMKKRGVCLRVTSRNSLQQRHVGLIRESSAGAEGSLAVKTAPGSHRRRSGSFQLAALIYRLMIRFHRNALGRWRPPGLIDGSVGGQVEPVRSSET